eukprot:TRINITY_DN2271_c0_g1_i1.p1 TRINITY_DN2271_c0_g1~~TRINITY_DN2271_c0_g1_i1.p1  ORF type:complete len:388 (+),score=38.56 TRINITY_DN2271_c0_g1_i1:82-1245(+)
MASSASAVFSRSHMLAHSFIHVCVCVCLFSCPSNLAESLRRQTEAPEQIRSVPWWYGNLTNQGTVSEQLAKQDSRFGYSWHSEFTSAQAVGAELLKGAKYLQMRTYIGRRVGARRSECIAPDSSYDVHEQAMAIAAYTGESKRTNGKLSLYLLLNHDLRQLHDYSKERESSFNGNLKEAVREVGGSLVKDPETSPGQPEATCLVNAEEEGKTCFLHRWGGYLYWMLRGFRHFAADKYVRQMTLYRYITLDEKPTFEVGTSLTWPAFSSSSATLDYPLRVLKQASSPLLVSKLSFKFGVLFVIQNAEGVGLDTYSDPDESEVLILPGASVYVKEVLDNKEATEAWLKTQKLDEPAYLDERVVIVIVEVTALFDIFASNELPPPNDKCQ